MLTLHQHLFCSPVIALNLPSTVILRALLSFIFMVDTDTSGQTLQDISLVFQRTYEVIGSVGHIQIPIIGDR